MTDMTPNLHRRTVLRSLGAASLGAATGVAGCSTGPGTGTQTESTPTDTATASPTEKPADTATPSPSLDEAPLERQLAVVRSVTEPYRGSDGIERAFDEGFVPVANAGEYVLSKTSLPDSIDLREPVSLTYLRQDGEMVLAAAGYGVPYFEGGPPDVFNDEDADVKLPESEGWFGGTRTLWAGFSNGDDTVDDVTDLPHDVVFDGANWQWAMEKPGAPGDRFDVDGDGEAEVLDFVYERPPVWAIHVWVHVDNPCGVFDFAYTDDGCGAPG